MKKYHYVGPTFTLVCVCVCVCVCVGGGPWVSLLNFEGVPGPGSRFAGSRGPGSRGPSPIFTPCLL